MALFSCGQHETLLALHEAAIAAKEAVGSSLPAGATGFADDTTVFIGERGVNMLIDSSREILGRNRVKLRVDKCKILVHPGRRDEVNGIDAEGRAIPPAFEVVDSGLTVLGTPVGTEGYRRAALEKAFADMARPVPALTRVDPQSAFTLLQLCFNARPCFLTRVSEPHLYMDYVRTFDKAVDNAVAAIARTPPSAEIGTLRSLPQSMGGLSLPRHCGPQSEEGTLASRAMTKSYVMKYRPELAPGMECWRHIEVGTGNEARYRAELVIEDDEEVAFADLDRSLPRDILLRIADYKYSWMALYQRLRRTGRRHHAAWLLSGSSTGTGKWLTWRGGLEGRFRFGSEEFVEALRLRLLVDPLPTPGNSLCPHCAGIRFTDAPLHALECPRLQPARRW
ncbi:MAG: hypothetical protein EBT15_12815, partial [Betaproteobacteria bacterium]|nr:hypothetical protein [Betaproteobacteria bacterium]